ncbi:hypothetical protein BBI15_15130 [Planococcus plakortidis]|uniref:DNA 3'-5' helicase n=1 Tax=Planococcus plakortidis TaxID=1038856 RepID=A0A1C7ECK9_9BACL|nr:ATP-dependent helicase [Planococcus plakortidis]ANU21416.1 hypothetical protein BBI15_15130 [Planococcus plakortidis]
MQYTLTRNQKEIVEFNEGSLLVIAGAGSGKTHILTERVRKLIYDKRGHYRVLALTFTNKAAQEMKERLNDVEELENKAFIGTIHNFCLDVLSAKGDVIGIKNDFHIFGSDSDKIEVLRQIVESTPQLQKYVRQHPNYNNFLRLTIDYITRQKRSLKSSYLAEVSSAIFESDEKAFSYLYREYDDLLRSQNALDYDDLIFLTYRIFTERPAIAKLYKKLYKYLCIDEAQDLNFSQYQLIKSFCGKDYNNTMLVGDPNQAIFGFIGSSSKFMCEQYIEDFRPEVFYLKENFRSAENIVKVAKRLEPAMEIEAVLPIQGEVSLQTFTTELEEAKWVYDNIKNVYKNGHPEIDGVIPYENIAVLGRNRYVLSDLEEILEKDGIPYYTKLSDTFESESEFAKAFELGVRLIINPVDMLHLQQLLNLLNISHLNEKINGSNNTNGIELLNEISKEITGEWKSHIDIINHVLKDLSIKNPKFNVCIDKLTEYANKTWNESDENFSLVINDLNMWKEKWRYYVKQTNLDSRNLIQFRNQISMGITQKPREGVALLTVHTAKGLEFDVVYIMGMCDGTFPDYRAIKKGEESLLEEKHNAFVAITRAKRVAYLTYPLEKQFKWGTKKQIPSRFLKTMGFI